MLYVPNETHRASINLAKEHYLLQEKEIDDVIIFFYINQPSVIIGRHQNTLEEINDDYVDAHHIDVVRRLSGGGAVYHDLGNLNFSFILPTTDHYLDFETLTQPIVDAIRSLGVEDVHLSGRNDLLIGEQKFSGNAMYRYKDRMFCHGTLLFNSDLTKINDILTVEPSKLKKKGVASVRSRVTNIQPHLNTEYKAMTTEDFKAYLLQYLFQTKDMRSIPTYTWTKEDNARILEIEKHYYASKDWNYGKSPDYNQKAKHRFDSGLVEVRMLVYDNIIQRAYIYGDFFGTEDTQELSLRLQGIEKTPQALATALKDNDVSRYLGKGVTNEAFITLLLEAQ